ncbi:metallophosphoesterase family protein [Embleya sp. AB8]|uniref:metallophosphoesterase family protein n=1 Tax=Embleya sp. AB8 TaxID=3156304 RepID=UPI003C77AB9B
MSNVSATPAPMGAAAEQDAPLYVVGDVHGHLEELKAALRARDLIDADAHWSGGRARLWFLGDFTDRGPDGIGVVELAMALARESAEAGGSTRMLLGNHEILLLGVYRFGDHPVPVAGGSTTFREIWLRNGGMQSDLDRFTDEQAGWLAAQPVAAVVDGHLLIHSDSNAYLEYGDTIEEVDGTVADILREPDPLAWWDLFRNLTRRGAFMGEVGPYAAADLLGELGGRQVVHGHTPIPYQTGEDPSTIVGPRVYADGQAVNLDGGIYLGGPCLVARLPLNTPEPGASVVSLEETQGREYDLGALGAGPDEEPES